MIDTTPHPTATFWLDVVDKAVKLVAVFIGALWTYWNYRKSRTYEQKLELEISGTVFREKDLYGDLKAVVKNIGATRHEVEHTGTFCEVLLVHEDLREDLVFLFRVFEPYEKIEPGESMKDTHCWRVQTRTDHKILWVKLVLRVVSDGVEWSTVCLIRTESESAKPSEEVE